MNREVLIIGMGISKVHLDIAVGKMAPCIETDVEREKTNGRYLGCRAVQAVAEGGPSNDPDRFGACQRENLARHPTHAEFF